MGNGVTESFVYDNRGRLLSASAVNSGQAVVYSLKGPANNNTNLQYAPDGAITAATDSVNGAWTYGSDSLNRVSSAAKSGGNSYTYYDGQNGSTIDRNANRNIQYVNGSQSPGYVFNQGTNQLSTTNLVTYDAAGNVQTWNDGSMTHTYTYDAEGRIVSIDSASIQYTYDALGRRVQKNLSGTTDEYVYDVSGNMVADINGNVGGARLAEIWAGARHLATYTNSTTYFPHTDWLGSARAWSDVNGNVARTCTDSPYGDALSCSGSEGQFPSTYNFAGMEQDAETGFYHTQFRYYNPKLGSWMTPDPAGLAAADPTNAQSLNRYAYTWNAPTALVDPLGLLTECPPGTVNPDGTYCGTDPYAPTDVRAHGLTCLPDLFGAAVVVFGDVVFNLPPCQERRPPDHPQKVTDKVKAAQATPQSCKPGQRCTDAYQRCMNGLDMKATVAGVAEAVTGAPDEIKETLHTLSTNRNAVGAVASVDVASYYALGEGAAATVGTALSEFLIPAAAVGYGVWRLIR